jgi:hypothetical protein
MREIRLGLTQSFAAPARRPREAQKQFSSVSAIKEHLGPEFRSNRKTDSLIFQNSRIALCGRIDVECSRRWCREACFREAV